MNQEYIEPSKREKYGSSGKSYPVKTNFFQIRHNNSGTIHHYDVNITPEVPVGVNKDVFKAFEVKNANNAKVLGGICAVFDGAKNMFSPRALPFGKQFVDEVILPEEGGKKSNEPRKFKLKMMKVNEVPIDINEMHQRTSNGLTAMMAFNVLFRHQNETNFVQVKNSFFIREDVNELSGGVELWPGFFRSFNSVADGFALNIDTTICSFYQPGPVVDIVAKLIGLRNPSDLRDSRTSKYFRKIKSFLKGLKVTMSIKGEQPRSYKIRSVSDNSAVDQKFDLIEDDVNKGRISVAKYIENKYSIKLQYPNLPCVEIKKGVLLPLELFTILPGQRYVKKLDEKQTSEMIKVTCIKPYLRFQKIANGMRRMAFEKNKYIKQFGLEVTTTAKEVPARLLSAPTIKYNPSSKDHSIRPANGSWNMLGKRLFEGKQISTWGVAVYARENWLRRPQVEKFVDLFSNVCIDTGMKVTDKRPIIKYLNPFSNRLEEELGNFYSSIKNNGKAAPQLILCILPDRGSELYGAIKSAAELKIGVMTQCVQAKKVERPDKQYCANVCLKVNAKLGGINAAMHENDLGGINKIPTLIIGADVTHPAPGNPEAASIAAAIGSIDFTGTKYASSIRAQHSRQEVISDFSNMIVDLLKMFYKNTKTKPQKIIYYRDGVSDGQFQTVLINEMKAIKVACASLESNYKPKITFVVVQKRHHARFIPVKREDEDRSGNCKAGTIVEAGICHPYYFDFYLQSHAGLQGTSRPCHYHVLHDENVFTTDKFQQFTYNLCYLFNRATKSVSLVPPVYYAHLAATRARFHYKISDGMSDTTSMVSIGSEQPESKKLVGDLATKMYYV
ncbi:Piwi-domain-containing protein [Neoconidiobolus thromboides FSU 785]|nr:Piwi-domain-containing protein [Neoconidiobolus thromboides FSU 785]